MPSIPSKDQFPSMHPIVRRLCDGLADRDLPLLTPPESQFASGIVSFACGNPAQIAGGLVQQGVVVWGGDDRIRISVHLYNDMADIERCLTALEKVEIPKLDCNRESVWSSRR